MSLRWVHLSDFHVGKDDYGQRKMFSMILRHIEKLRDAGGTLDFVFLTGDVANSGLSSEYDTFTSEFFWPLLDCIPCPTDPCPIIIVPGNHDVDRTCARALDPHRLLSHLPSILDPSTQAQEDRRELLRRFHAFIQNDPTADASSHWLESPRGTLVREFDVRGQRVGIVGVNTAWVSCDDQDRHRLSLGPEMLRLSLEEISRCQLRIVLGHHPLGWLRDSESEAIQSLLGHAGALYLHGHLHRSEATAHDGAGEPYLVVQAGASFQVREGEEWRNRLLQATYQVSDQMLRFTPLTWNYGGQEWRVDADAFPNVRKVPNTDTWSYPLPTPRPSPTIGLDSEDTPSSAESRLPEGWSIIDDAFLESRAGALEPQRVLAYFDGRAPSWEEAQSGEIPRRTLVEELTNELLRPQTSSRIPIYHLLGPGGEGKSTVLYQTVCDLVSRDKTMTVLWHASPNVEVPDPSVLRRSGTRWLLASDDADTLAEELLSLARALQAVPHVDVRILLASRETDWINVNAHKMPWQRHADYRQLPLRGLTASDARMIITAWSRFADQGLGELYGLTLDDAVSRLQEAARNEHGSRDGSFLGAMLRTRVGTDLDTRIETLLERFGERSCPGGLLRDAFANIAVPHAEGVTFLSKAVLARALRCSRKELSAAVLGPLGQEATIDAASTFVLTRHRAIAESAVRILKERYGLDADEVLIVLADAAHELYEHGDFVPALGKWRFLSKQFTSVRRHDLAVRLAQAAYARDPKSPFFVVQLARALRIAGQPERSVELLRRVDGVSDPDRTYFFEWAISEGVAHSRCNSICLAAFSVSEQGARLRPRIEDIQRALVGMSKTFARLYDDFNRETYLRAAHASAVLGKRLPPDEHATQEYDEIIAFCGGHGAGESPPAEYLAHWELGVRDCWGNMESSLSGWLPAIDELSFHHFREVVGESPETLAS